MTDLSKYSDDELMGMLNNQLNTSQLLQSQTDPNDVEKSYVGGLEHGAAAMPMVLPNLLNQAAAGPQLLGRGIAETVDKALDVNPQPRGELWQPFNSSEDVLKQLPESLQPHEPQTAGGQIANYSGQALGNMLSGKTMQTLSNAQPNNSQSFFANNSSGPSQQKPSLPTSQDVRAAASQAYATANSAGGILKPNITDNFVNNAESVLPQEPRIKAMMGETSSTKIIDSLQSWRGTPMTLGETQELDKHLGDMMESEVDPKTGILNAQGNNLLKIQQALRDAWGNATEADTIGGKVGFDAAKEGRDLWAASSKANDIERIMTRAQYMDNPATGIKTGFRNLVANPSRMRGFTADEQDAIKAAAQTGIIANTLRYASSGLVPIIAAATGGGEAGGIGLAISHAAKTAVTGMQMNKANQALAQIMQRPVVQNALGNKTQYSQQYNPMQAVAGTMGSYGTQINQEKLAKMINNQ
jgi:hypothetical protein